MRVEKVRKAETMETTTAEPLVISETKMRRVDGAPLVESETGPATETAACNTSPLELGYFIEKPKG